MFLLDFAMVDGYVSDLSCPNHNYTIWIFLTPVNCWPIWYGCAIAVFLDLATLTYKEGTKIVQMILNSVQSKVQF